DIAGGGVHEHIEFLRAGKLRNLQQTGSKDLEVDGVGTLRSIGNILPGIKPLLPVGGVYNIALKRSTPVPILEKIKPAFEAAVASEAFQATAKSKYFDVDVRTGADADRRAALLESITAKTFWDTQEQIGKKVKSSADLGLPDPAKFAEWWPPQGYKPRM
ncbi:MAG: hypothetical protein VW405_19155, partial [Rhodospirillaceae bacterium]